MNAFTKKEYNKLQALESHFTRAVYGKYVYALRRNDFDKMYDVYKSLGYTKTMEYSCGNCLLELATTLGKLYFDYKKKMEEKNQKSEEKND